MSEEEIKILENFIRIYKEIETKKCDFFFFIKEIPIHPIENLIDLYNKEKRKNFKRSDMIFCLKAENTKLKNRIQVLENADLTSVYINGAYHGEKKCKDKIKEKIKQLEKEQEQNRKEFSKGIDYLSNEIIESATNKMVINYSIRDYLQELLEESEE